MQRLDTARCFLIAGLVLVFGLFGIDKFLSPALWIGWVPPWMEGLLGFPRDAWLRAIGVAEILVAVLLLIPVRRVRQAGALLVSLELLSILTQTGWNDVGIRDAGLLLAAVALLFLL